MTVRVATSAQSQALTRLLGGSTGGSRKDAGGQSFDGVLSHVGDDRAAAATPSTTSDKNGAAPKAAQTGTPSSLPGGTTVQPGPSLDPSATGVDAIAALTGDPLASWTSGKTDDADGSQADSADDGSESDPGAAPTAFPQASLLALMQSAAALPPPASSTGPDADPASSATTSPTLPVTPDATSPAPSVPSVSNITFQTYLAPVSMSLPAAVADRPGAGRDATVSPGGSPQADPTSLTTLVAPPAQTVGQPTAGPLDPAVSSSPANGSPTDVATINQAATGAALGLVTPMLGNALAPRRDDAAAKSAAIVSGDGAVDPAAPRLAALQAAAPLLFTPSAPAPGLIAGLDPDARAAASATASTSDGTAGSDVDAGSDGTSQTTPVAIDALVATPPAAMFSAPLQTVADAITSLAAEAAGATQASSDPASRLSPARTMLLQLDPGELGTVSVRLHLTGRTLDVSLTASKDQTAALLDHGRDTLTRAIGDQDYQINSLVIQRSDSQTADTTSLPGSSNATTTDHPRNQGASQGGGDAAGGNSRQGADGSPARQSRSGRQPESGSASPARGTGLFL